MRKIYTRTVFEFNPVTDLFDVNQDESEFHFVSDDSPIAMMKGGGGGGSAPQTSSITNTDPWSAQQPYLKQGFQQANEAFFADPNFKMQFDPASIQSQNGILNMAGDNSSYGAAKDMLDKTLRGDYLTGGEGFNSALGAARNEIIPKVQSEFAARGRTGSGLAQTAEAGAVGDAFSKLYEQERQNQLRAGTLAPGIDEMKYAGYDRMRQVGGDREAQVEQNANARRNAVLRYLGAIQGNYGASSTSTNTGADPRNGRLNGWGRYAAGVGGGALAGAQFGPWGAGIGAGIGLLNSM